MFGIQRFCYLQFVAEKKQQKNPQNKTKTKSLSFLVATGLPACFYYDVSE